MQSLPTWSILTSKGRFLFQAVKNKVELAFLPIGPEPGLYYKPSQLLSIAAQTPYANEAAAFINFIINDPAGIKAIGVERGIPGSRKAQALLIPTLTPTQRRELEFTNAVSASPYTRLKEVLDPPAASQVATLFTQAATNVSLARTSVSSGAQSFYSAAQKALS